MKNQSPHALALATVVLVLLPGRPVAAPPLPGPPGDLVRLLDGREHTGLLEAPADDALRPWLYLTELQRPAGRPMFLVVRPIPRDAIAQIIRVGAAGRLQLQQEIERFRCRARIEAAALETVQLTELARPSEGGLPRYRFEGDGFVLLSTADEPTTRRVAVRVEQLFAAYRQALPPRTTPGRPLRVLVFGSMEEYRDHLRQSGLSLDNPAVYVRERGEIAAGSPLRMYSAELARITADHARLAKELAELERRLPGRLKELGDELKRQGTPRNQVATLLFRDKQRAIQEIESRRNLLRQFDRQNAAAFESVTGAMFRRLAHEALHAHLETRVYPPGQCDVPPWLAEGLATVFEAGLLEDGLLRVDAPNRELLAPLQDELKTGLAPGLTQVLAAHPRDFLIGASGSAEAVSRCYRYAWGIVYYLVLEGNLLTSDSLDRYVTLASAGIAPIQRFALLAGRPVEEFEPKWRAWIGELK